MTRVGLVLTALATVSVVIERLPAGAAKYPSLQGDWEIVAMAKNGQNAPPEAINEAFIRATATTFVPIIKKTNAEEPNSKLTYEVIGNKEINFFEVKSPPKTKKDAKELPPVRILKPGIYEFKGDTLKICWSESVPGLRDATTGEILVPEQKMDRPTDFTGGIGQFSITLKRKVK